MTQSFFPAPDPDQSIDQVERNIQAFWKAQNIFQRSIDTRHENQEFVFLDGPPFATGSPHYGHILAGTTKDAVPRYWTMKGYRVNRKFGWDCHGLPVEYQVEKEHGIGGKPGIESMGVGEFNELCRSIVMRCADEWKDVVPRMGRFVDFENDYKTMDPEFMESVWWVFKTLWDKGLIYEGHKVVSYSPKLGSPLSNFEANLNYKDIDDPTVTVRMSFKEDPETSLLFWTTTPWTIPCLSAVTLGKKLEYSKVKHQGENFIVATNLLEKNFGEDYEVLNTMLGESLVGKELNPVFDYFDDGKRTFPIIEDDYVTDTDGTGFVPTSVLGEEDALTMQRFNIDPVEPPIDENGYYNATIPELAGKYFRSDPEVQGSKEDNVNETVIQKLKASGQLFKRDQYRHRYPHCWRTECCLMSRPIKTWFVKVSAIKDRMIELNQQINWTPSHLKDGRFGKILEGAPDWAISRNRYWGTPLPVWRGEKTGKCVAIGSREELEARTGQKVDDLHKHFVDDLTWEENGETFRRIEEVLDCWFESGSMPYASVHYPFSGQEFKAANFISENMDQTRGWFYTLHVLGTALLDKPIFQNVTCGGIVLAEDGQKMSKSKKNYPDPNLIFEKYGADAMRFYLLQSPVATKGENLKFSEREVEEVLKNLILPLKNAYQFLQLYANIDGWAPTKFSLIRHGDADHNVARIYSSKIDNPHHLTPKGTAEAKAAAAELSPIDQLYASPLVRTQETATVLKAEQNFAGPIHTEDRLREIDFGNLEGQPYIGVDQRLADPSTENLADTQARTAELLAELQQKHVGQHVALVSHGGTIRSLLTGQHGITRTQDHLQFPAISTGQTQTFFPLPQSENELDGWILSELQTLIKAYVTAFDQYDTETVCRLLPPFVDKLNNWYLRRNRKRFWAEGLSQDKQNGYATLQYTLFTLSKLLAPICPFFADWLYQNVSGEPHRSVHLDFVPSPVEAAINPELETRVDTAREIVSLAASIRSRAGIKLRQPLPKLQFALSHNTEVDLDLIASEANVKEVEQLKTVEGVATAIIKVDARQVGKKFGPKVQQLIAAGKNGDFTINADGSVDICGEKLQAGEYETAFLTKEGSEADATARTVVIVDTTLSPELEREGEARELIRAIQDLRKSSGFEVSDRITVTYQTESQNLQQAIEQFHDHIATEVLAESIQPGSGEHEAKIDNQGIKLSLTKA